MNESKKLRVGSVVDGKYKILKAIGRGGMSYVWLAFNSKANKQWAIKEIRYKTKHDIDIVKQNLITEIEILKDLRHENLPQIIDILEQNDSFLIIMDFIEGRTLKDIVEEHGAQPQEDVVNWGLQLCSVLQYLHSREPAIIYRDMKPGNVMLRPDGKVILIDFGTAREYKQGQDDDTVSLGTLGYAAPEQFEGEGQTDARTDIYNLGATLYHLVTGKNPSKPPYEMKPIREWNPALSSGLEAIILKCIAKDPENRYQSAKELAFALEHYRELEDSYRKDKKKKTILASLLLAGAVLSLTSGIVMSQHKNAVTEQTYESQLYTAESSLTKELKIQNYIEAINISPERQEAYDELLNAVYLEDGEFTQEEAEELMSILGDRGSSGTETIRDKFKKNAKAYDEFSYDMGLAYFYYYNGDGNKSLALPWLNSVKDSRYLTPTQLERVSKFVKIAEFYANSNSRNKAGDSSLSFSQYWDDIVILASGNIAEEDNARTALVVYRELISQILLNLKDFRQAGVSKDTIVSEIEMVQTQLEKISEMDEFDQSYDQVIVDDIKSNIEQINHSLEIVYHE